MHGAAAVARGETLEQARRSVNLDPFRTAVAGDSQFCRFIFYAYVALPGRGGGVSGDSGRAHYPLKHGFQCQSAAAAGRGQRERALSLLLHSALLDGIEMNQKRILLTTTSSLDGWAVQEYLGPVSAEVVVGTGLLTDIFSSWTDFFGLQSLSYQSKLDQIKEKALAGIEYKALRLGANAVIGLRVDHDEIGAGGKSLLMVTAMGTAVRATKPGQVGSETNTSRTGAVSSHELNTQRHRLRLIQQADAGHLNLMDPQIWDFIVDNHVEELSPHVMDRVATIGREYSYAPAERDRAWADLKQFYLRLPRESAADHLYAAMNRSDAEAEFATQVIGEAGLLDIPRITAMLDNETRYVRTRVLQAVRADQPFYTAEDIPLLEALRGDIPNAFTPIPTTKRKGLLGEKEVWSCACGEAVDPKMSECTMCRRDRQGFPSGWLKPAAAVQLLTERLDLLRPKLGV